MEGGSVLKKLLSIFLAAVLMLPLYTQSTVAKSSSINQINQAIVDTYGQGFQDRFPEFLDTNRNRVKDTGEPAFNQDLFDTRGIVVYGEPFEYDETTGHHRYLGYTHLGEKYTNTLFRHDAFAGGRFHERNWFCEPERKDPVEAAAGELACCNFTETIRGDDNLREEIRDAALLGMFKTSRFEEAETFKDVAGGIEAFIAKIRVMFNIGDTNAATDILDDREWIVDLADYIYILSPPTENMWGMGRMWHQIAAGTVWYYTMPLAPLRYDIPMREGNVDFVAEIEPDGFLIHYPAHKYPG